MKLIFCTLAIGLSMSIGLVAQIANFKAIILDEHEQEPLIGVNVFFEDLETGSTTNINGEATLQNLPVGKQEIQISYIGFIEIDTIITLNEGQNNFTFYLEEQNEGLEEVVVSANRSTRTIQNIPTRIEFVNAEELGEKAIMNSSNISLVLRESTGIQIQQSSLSSGNSSIRIQGLDGRYTQLLKDGFPLYGGFANGLSIMQIPPLDIQQFEIIKGSTSTLYGGGAIAGLVNMTTKTPDFEPDLEIMLTQTQALGSTANVFYSKRKDKIGYTLYGSAHYQNPYDPDGDDFTNLALTKSVSLNPKLFIYPNKKSEIWIGLNGSYDNRTGGDLTAIKNTQEGEHQYIEENTSQRISSQAVYNYAISNNKKLQVKNSIAFFNRNQETSLFTFKGKQWDSFTEATYRLDKQKSETIVGANFYTINFTEDSENPRNQKNATIGAFGNNTTDLNKHFILESGFRTDYSPDWGVFALPRLSLLWKPNNHFSSRVGGGLGYKIPDLFTEEATQINFQNILPIDSENLVAERSYGLNLDFNYKNLIADKITYSINQLFYVTDIQNALLLESTENGLLQFTNAPKSVRSLGAETNIKFTYKDFKWFINYAFINAKLNYLPNKPQKPLTAKHNAGMVLMYENDKWRVGYEAYYTGKQELTNGNTTDDFVIMGLLIQKHFEWGSPFINFENFTDRRQARFSSETNPPHETPVFSEIYAPTDGFIFSIGVVLKPFGNTHAHHHHDHSDHHDHDH